jgi:hypothetical protein
MATMTSLCTARPKQYSAKLLDVCKKKQTNKTKQQISERTVAKIVYLMDFNT